MQCVRDYLNPPYGRMSNEDCFREDSIPIGNYTIGTNSSDFGLVKNIEPYYSLIEFNVCTLADGKLGAL